MESTVIHILFINFLHEVDTAFRRSPYRLVFQLLTCTVGTG